MGVFQDTVDAVSDGFSGAVEGVSAGVASATTSILSAINSNTSLAATSLSDISVGGAVVDLNSGKFAFSGSFKVAGQTAAFDIKWDSTTQSFSGSQVVVAGTPISLNPAEMGATVLYLIEHSVEWIPNFGVVERIIESDYDDVFERLEQQYGNGADGNVYLASEEFVRWANPTTLASRVITLIFSAGAASELVISEVRAKAKAEFGKIKTWLQAKVSAAVNIDVDDIVTRILNGERPSLLLPNLTFRWQNIQYKSHVRILGNDINATNIPITHWGFVIIWDAAGTPINFQRLNNNGVFKLQDADAQPINPKWRLGVKPQYTTLGCLAILVPPGSPAHNAGIAPGDTILSVDGHVVGNIGGRHWVLWRFLEASATGKVHLQVQKASGATVAYDVQMEQLT